MTSSSSSTYSAAGSPWQERLEELCRDCQLGTPSFQIVSDRRGGRTAWSSRVTIQGQTMNARFWYDGKNLNNAREDAAELALNYWSTKAASPTHNWSTWGTL